MSNTSKKIKEIIVETFSLDEEPNETDNIFDDLGFDSLDAVELMMECEKEFGIAIPDEDASQARTVKHIIDIVKKLTGEE